MPDERSERSKENVKPENLQDPAEGQATDADREQNRPTVEQTAEPYPDGRTSTGFSPAEEMGQGVGGDRTISPGGAVSTGGNTPTDLHGFIKPPVNPKRGVIKGPQE